MLKVERSRKHFLFLLIGPLAVLSDQLLKNWVEANIPLNQIRPIGAQGVLVLTSLANSGVMWQKYSNMNPGAIEPYIRYYPTLFLAVYSAFYWKWRFKTASSLERTGFILLFFGGASNLWSHWKSYFATDTLQIYLGFGVYQPFNLADLWILLGTGLLLLSMTIELLVSLRRPSFQHSRS